MPAGPDPAALKQGEKIGKSVATPVAIYVRQGDPTPLLVTAYVGPIPFHVVHADGQAKSLAVVPGTVTSADAATAITVYALRSGMPVPLWSGTVGAWTLSMNDLGLTPVALLENDILFAQVTHGGGALPLPALLFLLTLDLS